ncbi:MAG: LysR family transcriptional regulator [Rhodocyclaceae bacterium]|nr:MAG: LysR family transcriptional regulator [Rhodocyclaceae bacterium]
MEFRQLKYFTVLAEELNYGRAAAKLHISQPPLTRQIQQMEEELGVQLFLRTPKGVELTAAGQLFLEDAVNVMALMQRATERTQLAGSGHLGRIDVGIFGSAMLNVIPRLLLTFRNLYPNVDMALHNMNKTQQIEALREKRLTIGFNRIIPESDDMVIERVLTERILVAVNRSHKFAYLREIPLPDIANQPLIVFPKIARPSFADDVIALCRAEGFHPNIVQEVEDVVTGVALVSSGFGISMVPESGANLKLPGVVYRPLKKTPSPSIDLSCVYRKNDQSPILQAFLDIIRAYRNTSFPIDTHSSS